MKSEQWRQVEHLYHAALALAPNERQQFVAEACAGDTAVLREVASLLACDEQAEEFLEKPAREIIVSKLAEQYAQPSTRLVPGQKLNWYEVRSLLGVGGMGEVYLARDLKLGRDVAIKVLPDYLARDPDRVRRFEREARVLALLSHPNIAAIHDLVRTSDRRFLVLELVPGITLAERLQQGPLSVEEALPLFRQFAAALKAAHEKGVVHRDLKPANIKITPDGTLKVLDFGIAKTIRSDFVAAGNPDAPTLIGSETVSDTLTREGVIVGTVAYMSPEQVRGREGELDHRSDLWAFGCVFYEALTGRQPFRGETITDTLGAIISDDPDWQALPKQTPVSIQYLIRHCLTREPAQRLADAGMAASEIEKSITGQFSPQTFLRLLNKRLSPLRNRTVLALASALLLVTSFAGWKEYRHRARIPTEKKLVVMDFRDESGSPENRAFGTGLAQRVRNQLLRIPGIQVFQPPAGDAALTSNPNQAARAIEASLILTGTVQRDGGRVRLIWNLSNDRWEMIDGDETEVFNDDATEVLEKVVERVHWSLRLREAARNATVSTQLPGSNQANYITALGYLRDGMDVATTDKAIALLDKMDRSAHVYGALGRAYFYKFNLTRNEQWLQQAESACLAALALDNTLPEVKYTLGLIQYGRGLTAQAITAFADALKLDQDNPEILLGLAAVEAESNQADKAEQTLQKVITLLPGYWAGYSQLGTIYAEQGRNEEALTMMQRVVELQPDSARSHLNLGNVYFSMGRFDEAIQTYNTAIRLDANSTEKMPDAHIGLGAALYYQGRYEEAAAAARAGLEIRDDDVLLWGNLADAYRWLPGKEAEAAGAYDQAIAYLKKQMRDDTDNEATLSQLAEWLAKRGRIREADGNIAKAMAIHDPDVYSMASAVIVYHLNGQDEAALKWARQAVRKGYSRVLLEKNPELKNLVATPAFQQIAH